MSAKSILVMALAALGVAAMLHTADAREIHMNKHLPAFARQRTLRPVRPGRIKRVKPVIRLGRPHLACKAWGAPEEFPASLLLTNDGKRPIFAGTEILWVMHYNHKLRGVYTFKKMLAVGKSVAIPGVRGGTGAGAPCSVNFLHLR